MHEKRRYWLITINLILILINYIGHDISINSHKSSEVYLIFRTQSCILMVCNKPGTVAPRCSQDYH